MVHDHCYLADEFWDLAIFADLYAHKEKVRREKFGTEVLFSGCSVGNIDCDNF